MNDATLVFLTGCIILGMGLPRPLRVVYGIVLAAIGIFGAAKA